MKSKPTYYSIKTKRKNLKLDYQKKSLFVNKKMIFLSICGSLFIISITTMAFLYLNTQARIEQHIESKEYREAIQLINRLLKENPNDPFALKAKGKVYFNISLNQTTTRDSKTLDRSISSLYKLLNTKNEEYIQSDVYFYLGCDFFLVGDNKKALKYLEKSITLDVRDHKVQDYIREYGLNVRLDNKLYRISLYGLIGYISYRLEEYKRAILYFEKAIQEEETIIYYLYLALAYRNLKIYDKAVGKLEIVIHKEKNADILEQSYYLLSNIYMKKNEYNQAKTYIRAAQKLKLSAESYYQLGLIFEAQRQIAKAIQFWKKAIKIDSHHNGTRRKLIRYEMKYKKRKRKRK